MSCPGMLLLDPCRETKRACPEDALSLPLILSTSEFEMLPDKPVFKPAYAKTKKTSKLIVSATKRKLDVTQEHPQGGRKIPT